MLSVHKISILSLVIALSLTSVFGAEEYNVLDFGAVPDGKTMNTSVIQKAIDQAYEDGGGTIIFPKGIFLTGGLLLKSNVQLHLNKGSLILGSDEISEYAHKTSTSMCSNRWKGLFIADGASNIGISGKGVINGQGNSLGLKMDSLVHIGEIDSSYYELNEKRVVPHLRPQIIRFVHCTDVVISGITIENSASWVQTYETCMNLVINGIRVESTQYWNNDGIDIMDCKNVSITNCYVNSSDDGICLKSFSWDSTWFCDNIYIANCKVRSSASAVKIGTSSRGGFSNIVIENIQVFDTYRSAIAIECYEAGFVENILVQNIRAVNTGNAIFIRLGRKQKFENEPMGRFRNIVIKNVKVKVPFVQPDLDYQLRGPALPFFHNIFPSSITGIPGYPVENIVLENITIEYPGKGNPEYANLPTWRLDDVPEEVGKYPEFSMFGELPSWAFYVRHVNGLVMKDIRVKIKEADYRPAFVFDDVNDLTLESITIKGDAEKESFIFKDSNIINEIKK